MIEPTSALDLWTLFVVNVFGNFWMTIAFLMLLFLIIMGFLGRMSPLTIIYYNAIFLVIMATGYGMEIISIPLVIILFVWVAFTIIGWFNRQ